MWLAFLAMEMGIAKLVLVQHHQHKYCKKQIHQCNTTNIGTAKFFNQINSKAWEQGTK
jgi:hypothetical protein